MTLDEDLGPEWSLLHGSFERVRHFTPPVMIDKDRITARLETVPLQG